MKIKKGTIIDVYEQCSPEMKEWFDNAGPEEHAMLLEGLVDYNLIPQEMYDLMKEVIIEHDGQMTQSTTPSFLLSVVQPFFQKNFQLH